MSGVFKLASIATGFTVFGFSALHTMRNSKQDFSSSALALEHTFEAQRPTIAKPKLPSNFVPIAIGGYELRSAA